MIINNLTDKYKQDQTNNEIARKFKGLKEVIICDSSVYILAFII
jgi:hypothetical protein